MSKFTTGERVWIELERPVLVCEGDKPTKAQQADFSRGNVVTTVDDQRAVMQARCDMANRMIERLTGVKERKFYTDSDGKFEIFFVYDDKGIPRYARSLGVGFETLNDNGSWFNLAYLGREGEE